MQINVVVANKTHVKYVTEILDTIETSAKARGTGIARRSIDYVQKKLVESKAIIALTDEGVFAGFSYIEIFQEGKFLVNSGLIVHPDFRNMGLAKRIKARIFAYSKELYPDAKIVSITTSLAVLKLNTDLGYRPVTFSELPQGDEFWNGCKTCVNFDVLERTGRKMCLCTGLLYDGLHHKNDQMFNFEEKSPVLQRLKKIKTTLLGAAKKMSNPKEFIKLAFTR
ncbi:MAG: GNAT family N-acetyltransferase [Ichthyobacteriaceae bacterium]|nr:GNAT family N-acetyltransferase [Ichthyobacteriaceae bacterium]